MASAERFVNGAQHAPANMCVHQAMEAGGGGGGTFVIEDASAAAKSVLADLADALEVRADIGRSRADIGLI